MQESTRSRLEGDWEEWKGRLKSRWSSLTNVDLERAEGDIERLAGIIRQRTGESLHAIHGKLDDLVHERIQ